MTKNIMKLFEFLAVQIWEKYIDFKKTKGKNASACLKEKKEETHEPPSSEIGGVEEVVLEYDRNSLPSDSKKYEETSHKYEEVSIENTEDHFETHSTLAMKQRASTNGCLNCEGVPIDGCSKLNVSDIDIRFENVSAIQISHKHEDQDLVTDNEEPISTSPSPLELQDVNQIKKKEEEEVHSHEPSLIEGYLKMSEMDIHEALRILHDTK